MCEISKRYSLLEFIMWKIIGRGERQVRCEGENCKNEKQEMSGV